MMETNTSESFKPDLNNIFVNTAGTFGLIELMKRDKLTDFLVDKPCRPQ